MNSQTTLRNGRTAQGTQTRRCYGSRRSRFSIFTPLIALGALWLMCAPAKEITRPTTTPSRTVSTSEYDPSVPSAGPMICTELASDRIVEGESVHTSYQMRVGDYRTMNGLKIKIEEVLDDKVVIHTEDTTKDGTTATGTETFSINPGVCQELKLENGDRAVFTIDHGSEAGSVAIKVVLLSPGEEIPATFCDPFAPRYSFQDIRSGVTTTVSDRFTLKIVQVRGNQVRILYGTPKEGPHEGVLDLTLSGDEPSCLIIRLSNGTKAQVKISHGSIAGRVNVEIGLRSPTTESSAERTPHVLGTCLPVRVEGTNYLFQDVRSVRVLNGILDLEVVILEITSDTLRIGYSDSIAPGSPVEKTATLQIDPSLPQHITLDDGRRARFFVAPGSRPETINIEVSLEPSTRR